MKSTPRPGFSLIELLVVIAMIAVLSAISVGAFFRVRGSQMVNATESTLSKLNSGLDRMWSAHRDQADKEFTNAQLPGRNPAPGGMANSKDRLLTFTGINEKERARSVWLYFRIKNEMPQTFPEAILPTTLGSVVYLPAKQRYLSSILTPTEQALYPSQEANPPALTALANTRTPATAQDANNQSAHLLYVLLTESGLRGEQFDSESLKANVGEVAIPANPPGPKFKVYLDAWRTPITFVRFLNNPEIDQQPIARLAFETMALNQTNNPLDPTFRLKAAGWPAPANFTQFCTSAGIATADDLRHNFVPSVVSAGPRQERKNQAVWGDFDLRGQSGIYFRTFTPGSEGKECIYGYRLRQFGGRGE